MAVSLTLKAPSRVGQAVTLSIFKAAMANVLVGIESNNVGRLQVPNFARLQEAELPVNTPAIA